MTAPGLTYKEFVALGVCAESKRRVPKLLGGAEGWGDRKITAAEARAAGCTMDDIAWAASLLSKNDADIARRLRLWAADCAAHVLHIYEAAEAEDAPRRAIIAARAYARGEIGAEELAAAQDAARRSAWRSRAAWRTVLAAAWAVADGAIFAAAKDGADAAATAALAERAERAWQFDRLILWLSYNEPEDWPLPARKTREAA